MSTLKVFVVSNIILLQMPVWACVAVTVSLCVVWCQSTDTRPDIQIGWTIFFFLSEVKLDEYLHTYTDSACQRPLFFSWFSYFNSNTHKSTQTYFWLFSSYVSFSVTFLFLIFFVLVGCFFVFISPSLWFPSYCQQPLYILLVPFLSLLCLACFMY